MMLIGCQAQEDRSPATATPVEYQRDFQVLEAELDEDFATQIAEQLEFVQVASLPLSEQQDVVVNPEQDTRAFIVSDGQDRLFIEELETNQLYELQGPLLSWRPISGLTWLNNDVLAFDQWSNPHHGVHYEINIRERKLILVSIITDVTGP
jgi:hypothetical protein